MPKSDRPSPPIDMENLAPWTMRADPQGRGPSLIQWGMIPHWATDTKVGNTFNTRADTVTTKPTFRGAWLA